MPRTRLFIFLVSAWFSVPAHAQWTGFRTPGIPRLEDGKPDLAAPAPKLANGHPDFSGLWRETPQGSAAGLIFNRPPIGIKFQPWAEAISKKRIDDQRKDAPPSRCMPWGPFMHIGAKVIHSPDAIVIIPEDPVSYPRIIFLDGRALPKDPEPTWWGYSVGHWDGEALVVETTGITDRQWMVASGPISPALRITERWRRTDFGHMERMITLNDPGVLVQPFTYTMTSTYRDDDEVMEMVCENEKDVVHMVGK